jgi:hypothetical protein
MEARLERFRLARGLLESASDDAQYRERFREIYAGCLETGSTPLKLPRVRSAVRCLSEPPFIWVEFEDPEPLDTVPFVLSLFPERGFVDAGRTDEGFDLISTGTDGTPFLAAREPHLLVDRDSSWQPLVASLAVNRLLRRQNDVFFLHAASVSIKGRGALFVGPKGAGKSTLSLTLGARGHDFLGDEIAAVSMPERVLLPFRRSASLRSGPRSPRVEALLDRAGRRPEIFPDGTPRLRLAPDGFLPGRGTTAPLRAIFFLRGFAPSPVVEAASRTTGLLGLMTPLAASLWGPSRSRRLMQLLELVSTTRCYLLEAGDPDPTADAVELTIRKGWR